MAPPIGQICIFGDKIEWNISSPQPLSAVQFSKFKTLFELSVQCLENKLLTVEVQEYIRMLLIDQHVVDEDCSLIGCIIYKTLSEYTGKAIKSAKKSAETIVRKQLDELLNGFLNLSSIYVTEKIFNCHILILKSKLLRKCQCFVDSLEVARRAKAVSDVLEAGKSSSDAKLMCQGNLGIVL